jgi:Rho termination factor, N-terminal domain
MKPTGPPLNYDILRRDASNKAVVTQRVGIKSTNYESTLKILKRDDSKKAVVTPRFGIKKSSRLPSTSDRLIRDNGDNTVALPTDYKPPRPTSRFVRRSPIPISNPAKEEANTIPQKHTPSVNVREPFEEMSVTDRLKGIMNKPRPPRPEIKWDIPEILRKKETPKFRIEGGGIAKAEPEPKPKEAVTTSKLGYTPKAEPQSETNSELEPNLELNPNSELDVMTLSELKDIAKAQGLKGYSKLKKAKLLEILKGTPP